MRPGAVVAERFTVLAPAGHGGMATVWRAHDRFVDGDVALKLLRHPDRDDADRFAHEAELLASLSHPAVVRYVAHGTLADGEQYLALEWLEGEDLGKRLATRGLSVPETLALARRVAEGLAAIHGAGIVHRDIKPTNVFLVGGDASRCKLLDFGVARSGAAAAPPASARGARPETRTGTILGTPAYMAPEQARGQRHVDARADVFSLGAVLFECLAGRPPFGGDHVLAILAKVLFEEPPRLTELLPGLDAELAALVAQMLAKEPHDRPRDGAAVARRLAQLGEVPAPPSGPARSAGSSITGTEQRILCVIAAGGETTQPDGGTALMPTIEVPGGTLSELREVAQRFGAPVERLVDGSVIVTLLGAGSATDQVTTAARCALELRRVRPDVPMALATGRAVVAGRWPVGEAIDRVVALLRRGGATAAVRLDASTAGLLDARFEVGDDDGPVLVAERTAVGGVRTLLGRPTPCIGRERELAMLSALYDECVSESVARAVVVVGGAGIGKSRLRYELLRRLEQRPDAPAVWIGRGDPMAAGAPYGLLAQALRTGAGIEQFDDPHRQRALLSARVARALAPEHARRVATFLAELLGVGLPDDEGDLELRAARRDAVLMGDQVARAWEDLVAAETARGPVVIVFEDLHWGDAPSVRLCDTVLRNLAERPLLVLALGRPEIDDVFPRLWVDRNANVVSLPELTRRAGERLVRAALGSDVSDEVVAQVVERAQGNAFYLEELVRAVSEGDSDRLPDTVLAMLQARLDSLEAPARQILRAGSVFGQAFRRAGVAALLGGQRPESEVAEWLDVLARREIVSVRHTLRSGEREGAPVDAEYVFRHALVREAAYAMLTDTDRQLGHRLAGAWLEATGNGEPLALAEHYERGGEASRAIAFYLRAAEHALGASDLPTAIARAERGASLGATGAELGALRLVQAEAGVWRGEFTEASRRCAEALALLPAGGGPWLRTIAQAAECSRSEGEGARLAELAAALSSVEPDAEIGASWASAAARTVAGLLTTGDVELAPALVEHMARLADRLADDAIVRAWLQHARSWLAMYEGDMAGCLVLDGAAAEAFGRVGDLRNVCRQLASVGYDMMELGGYAEASATFDDVVKMAGRMGLWQVTAMAQHNLGLCLLRLGRGEEGEAAERTSILAFQAHGNVRLVVGGRTYLAMILAERGDLDGAETLALQALDQITVAPPFRPQVLATLARIRLLRGDPRGALPPATEARTLIDATNVEEGEALARLVYAEALAALGDARAQREIASARARLLERAARIGDPGWRASFLERVPENARTLALARLWVDGGSA